MTDTLASPAPCCRGHRFLRSFFAFSYHICCVGAYSSVCVCVPVCACDYKSHSANRISVLRAIRAISSHTRQMMMLSAHNTIFFLPRFQHIVLFRKQTFQPILFVMVHGSGHEPAHLGKHMRYTQRNGAKERMLIRNPDTPKGGVHAISCFLHSYIILLLFLGFPNDDLWNNSLRFLPKYEDFEVQFHTYWTRVSGGWESEGINLSEIVVCHGQVILMDTQFEKQPSIFLSRQKTPTCRYILKNT